MRKSKNNKNNTTTIIPSTSDKTPIEIALQIDSDGMTTASKLYAFLELNPSNFASWCRRNITRNKFATENEDYIVFVVENENPKLGGRPKTDYKLTSEFAKKLSMTGNTEKHEQARNYFIACEQGLKIATAKLQARNDDIQALAQSVNNLVQKIDSKFVSLESRVSTLENKEAVDDLNEITGKQYKIDFDTTDPDKIQQQLNEISSEVDKHVTTDSEGNPHYDESQEGAVEAEKAYKAEVQHQQQNEYETSAMGQYESDNNLVQAMQNFMQAKNEMDTQTQYAQKGMDNTLQTATDNATQNDIRKNKRRFG